MGVKYKKNEIGHVEMHEAEVMMANMAAPILGHFPNAVSLIVDIKSICNMSGKIRLLIPMVRCSFGSISPAIIDLSPVQEGHH